MSRRIIDLFVASDLQRFQVSATDTAALNKGPIMRRGENLLLRFNVFLTGTTVREFEADTTFYLGIDNVYTPEHAEVAESVNTQFNVEGDWEDQDITEGKICARLNLNTEAVGTLLGSSSHKAAHLVIWATPPAGDPYLVVHAPITLMNVAVEPQDGSGTAMEPLDGETAPHRAGTATNTATPPNTVTFVPAYPEGYLVYVTGTLFGSQTEQRQVEILTQDETGFTWRVQNGAGVETSTGVQINWVAIGFPT